MWIIGLLVASTVAGLLLGPLLARAAAEQTADPRTLAELERALSRNRLEASEQAKARRAMESAPRN